MDFQKVADAVEKANPKIKDMLFSEELGQFISDLATNNKLDEETTLNLTDEIGYLILGLKERSTFKSTLSNLSIDKSAALIIIQEVSRKIFSELDEIESSSTPSVEEIKAESNEPAPSNEESKSDLAPSNLPMIEEGESAHEVAHTESEGPILKPEEERRPINIPKKEINLINTPVSNPYKGSADPYREPLN